MSPVSIVFAASKNVKPMYLTESGKEDETDPRYKRNRRAIISNANKRGTIIKSENLKKYNIKKVNGKYV
jgi:hypothetical protein